MAYRDHVYLTLAATLPFSRLSCGYVGVNDGWTDLAHNSQNGLDVRLSLGRQYRAHGEIDLSRGTEFTLGVGFGHTRHSATTTLYQSLSIPFDDHLQHFNDQWESHQQAFRPPGQDRRA